MSSPLAVLKKKRTCLDVHRQVNSPGKVLENCKFSQLCLCQAKPGCALQEESAERYEDNRRMV